MHSESLLRPTDSLRPASHLRAPTIEVVASVPVLSWFRDLNHQVTAKSTFASKTGEAVRVAMRRRQRTISMMKTVACRDHCGGDFLIPIKQVYLLRNLQNMSKAEFSLAARSPSEFAPARAWPSSLPSSLRPWHDHCRRSASIGAEPPYTPQGEAREYTNVM